MVMKTQDLLVGVDCVEAQLHKTHREMKARIIVITFPCCRSRIRKVRVLRQLVGILMLGLAFGSPVMACLIPGVEMTAAERECCHKMAYECSSSAMASSHTCCQTPPQRDSAVSPTPTYSPARHFAMAVIPQVAAAVSHSASISRQLPTLEVPPPEPSPGCSSVLRI